MTCTHPNCAGLMVRTEFREDAVYCYGDRCLVCGRTVFDEAGDPTPSRTNKVRRDTL